MVYFKDVKIADIVQARIGFYLEPVATVDGYGTVTLESRKGTPAVFGGRRTAPAAPVSSKQ